MGRHFFTAFVLLCLGVIAVGCAHVSSPSWNERAEVERGEAAVVVYRYTKGDERKRSGYGLAFCGPAGPFKLAGSRPIPRALSKELSDEGWYYQVLEPGRHVSLIEHKGAFDSAPMFDAPRIEFAVPEGAGILYVGSIHYDIESGEPVLSDEWARAAALIEAERAEGKALSRIPGPVTRSLMRRYDRPLPARERLAGGATVAAYLGDAPLPESRALLGAASGAAPGVEIMHSGFEMAAQADPLFAALIAAPTTIVGAAVAGAGAIVGAVDGSNADERDRIRELTQAFADAQVGRRLAKSVARGVGGRTVTEGDAQVEAWITRMDLPRAEKGRCVEVVFRVRARDQRGAVFFDRVYASRHPDAKRSQLAAFHELPLEREAVVRPTREWRGDNGAALLIEEVQAAITALGERVRIDLGPAP